MRGGEAEEEEEKTVAEEEFWETVAFELEEESKRRTEERLGLVELEMGSLDERLRLLELETNRPLPPPELLDDAAVCGIRIGALIAAGAPVAVDFEGVNLCRQGKLCLAQVATAAGQVFLLDVETLGESCFARGRLRELLESPAVVKIGYDCRADSDALW